MNGNLESGEVNPERSQLCYVIEELSAQNAPNGSTVDHTDDTTLSDRMHHEDSQLSLTDVSANESSCLLPIHSTLPTTRLGRSHSEPPIDENSEFHHQNIHITLLTDEMNEAQQWPVAKVQPQPISPQLTTSKQTRQPSTLIRKSSHKTSAVQINQVDGDDLCASILLACLFCQPWDCLLATGKGCHACASSLCSTVCCCEPDSLEPLLYMTHHCGCCGSPNAHCCPCVDPGFECCVCDICIQATECVDLGMEFSQMLFH